MPSLRLTGEEIYAIQNCRLNIDNYEVWESCPLDRCDGDAVNDNHYQQENSAVCARKSSHEIGKCPNSSFLGMCASIAHCVRYWHIQFLPILMPA